MVTVYNTSGKSAGKVELPPVFRTPYRPDVIQRAVVAVQAGKRSSYGTKKSAGLLTSADYFGRRRGGFRMTINRGMSRLPREKTGGGGLGKVRRVPQSVGGRRAHPPKPERDFTKKINKKEYSLALNSAIAATTMKELLAERGHIVPEKTDIPVVVEDSIQKISKAKDLIKILTNLGLESEIKRTEERKKLSGTPRMRGRTRKQRIGVLVVVSEDGGIRNAASNITGLDVETISSLNIEDLAPGAQAGRLVVWSKSAVEKIGDVL